MDKEYIKKGQELRLKNLEEKRLLASKKATSSIPEEEWGVHESHCCFEHGCKYGDRNCPVELGITKQDFPCEICSDTEEEENNGFYQGNIKVELLTDTLKDIQADLIILMSEKHEHEYIVNFPSIKKAREVLEQIKK